MAVAWSTAISSVSIMTPIQHMVFPHALAAQILTTRLWEQTVCLSISWLSTFARLLKNVEYLYKIKKDCYSKLIFNLLFSESFIHHLSFKKPQKSKQCHRSFFRSQSVILIQTGNKAGSWSGKILCWSLLLFYFWLSSPSSLFWHNNYLDDSWELMMTTSHSFCWNTRTSNNLLHCNNNK